MSSEVDDKKVKIDCREVASKLSFLVGRTIMFRDGYNDSCTATQILAIKAENTPGATGHPCVSIYTTVGIQRINSSVQFGNVMVLEPDGALSCLGDYTDDMGVLF